MLHCDCCGGPPPHEIMLGRKRTVVLCHRCIREHGRTSRPCRRERRERLAYNAATDRIDYVE